nr:MAG TPA: hypothetical protein [Caudoviricetes sp.]
MNEPPAAQPVVFSYSITGATQICVVLLLYKQFADRGRNRRSGARAATS